MDAMLMHQRYFPLYDGEGRLTNKFIVVTNGDPAHAATITGGNERVVRARLSDAKFFYEEDLKHPLETYVDRLDEVVFQEVLGTMKDKTDRIAALARHLAADAQLGAADAADAERAAYLAKARPRDERRGGVHERAGRHGLVLRRGVGRERAGGPAPSPTTTARASPATSRPTSDVGRVVAMADKLDTVCGLFAVGQGPTGSSDPFALRRSAIGITAMLEAGLPVSLMGAVDASLATYADAGIDFDRDDVRAQVADFFVTRTKVMLRDSGASPDAIDAVLAAGVEEPAEVIARVRALEAARTGEREAFDDLATAYARANNLRDAELGEEVDEKLMGDAERALASAARDVESQVSAALAADDYAAALAALADLRAPIDAFFADVLVMDEDEAVRANRLRLLNRFVGVFTDVADFGKMAKGGK